MARNTTRRAIDFESLALENGLITDEQLDTLREAFTSQSEPRKPIEEVAVDRGMLDLEQVRAIQLAQKRLRKEEAKRTLLQIPGYEILSVLGDGGLGTVYRARQVSMNRIVALKVLHRQWVADEEFRKRFLLEARIVGKMSHPNLINVFDVGKEGGTYYFSMEFVDDDTVADVIKADKKIPPPRASEILIQVLRAIRYISEFGLVHRDIKPANILLTKTGQAKLGDFGFVQSQLDKELGYEGMVLGTPDYISPEQAMGADNLDYRSDIYSMGVTFFHMLTGKLPYDGTASKVMEAHVRRDMPSIREHWPDAPQLVVDVMGRMTARSKDDRYSDFDELFRDFEAIRSLDPKYETKAGHGTVMGQLRHEQLRLKEIEERLTRLNEKLEKARQKNKVLIGALGIAVLTVLILAFMV
jgi:serine/threonine-protein kinase